MPKPEQPINGQWQLSLQDKHILKIALVEYMVDNNFMSSDVLPDKTLAWNILPFMNEYHDKWFSIETIDAFQTHQCFKEFIKYLKVQFRLDG